jgi:PAS domain S-box-containing protein
MLARRATAGHAQEAAMTTGSDLLDALPVAIYTTDAEGRIAYYNSAAAALWGHRPQIGIDQWCGSWRLFWPDGTWMPHDQCPMAVALREGRAVRGEEAFLERPDGSRARFLPFPTPLRDASGRLVGAINLLVDTTEQHRTDSRAAHFAAMVESSDDAMMSVTLDGVITSWNAGATRVFGYEAKEIVGRPIGVLVPPELQGEEKRVLARLRQGERIRHYETVRLAKDGRRVDVSLSVSLMRDRGGRPIGASKVARDITERKKAEALQRMLIEELNHRVKNTLATVQAVASQSLLRAKSRRHFAVSFGGRIDALARAHTLLTQRKWQGAEVGDILRDQITLGPDDDNRIRCTGPSLTLEPETAMHLVLIVHELGTNARKYGALSNSEGRLSIDWSIVTNGARAFVLDWRESGGPRPSRPFKGGFGTTLIEQTLRACDGEVAFDYGADGVSCHLKFPLSQAAKPESKGESEARKTMGGSDEDRDPAEPKAKSILIIEDEPLLCMDIESSLIDAGYAVAGAAGTLEKARRYVNDGNFDAALVDANLAGHPVDDLVAALTRRNVPFAFVSGYGRDALPRGFQEAVLLSKPFSSEQLIEKVELLFERPDGVTRLRQKRG